MHCVKKRATKSFCQKPGENQKLLFSRPCKQCIMENPENQSNGVSSRMNYCFNCSRYPQAKMSLTYQIIFLLVIHIVKKYLHTLPTDYRSLCLIPAALVYPWLSIPSWASGFERNTISRARGHWFDSAILKA